ncbi:hypothetical protein H3221_013520 [Pseudomonas sp. LMG 31766]|uniref:Uncharacterized protein n=1 Tax=Pseudomonas chaetocerotis TaxID=2758695 RepID=A0A931D5F3_9PSED|nr:hypothetical protein [Pseudomonas chaetocerotis]MBZ9665771.1 hypothetical protein [Pseudomonas chaetocerotis]
MTDADLRDDEFHKLTFYVQRNIRYHMRRSAFFTRWSRVSSFVGVFFGSAAAVTFFVAMVENSEKIAALLAAIVALVSAIELVVGVTQRAWLHNDLRRRFLDIEEKMQANPLMPMRSINELKACIRRIEADEPPTMEALELMVRNEVIVSMYEYEDRSIYYIPLPWWVKLTAHWIHWDVSKAEPEPIQKAQCA